MRAVGAIAVAAVVLFMVSASPSVSAYSVSQQKPGIYVQPLRRAESGEGSAFTCPAVQGVSEYTCSLNWAGLVDPASNNTVTAAYASWVVPRVTCSPVGITFAAIWVGIDGFNDTTVEQTGVFAYCDQGAVGYQAWYEFYPEPSVPISNVAVAPGDVIKANVTYSGITGNFTTSIWSSGGGSNATSQAVPGASRSSAEWIVERPALCSFFSCELTSLADFGTASLGLHYTSVAKTNYASIAGVNSSAGSFPDVGVSMAGWLTGPLEAEPESVSSDGTSFQVVQGFGTNNPTVSVACSQMTLLPGRTTKCTATVAGVDPTGLVYWSSSGLGSLSGSVCRLKAGACSVSYRVEFAIIPSNLTANYLGDRLNAAASGSVLLTQVLETPRVAVSCSPTTTYVGSTKLITCKARVVGYHALGIVIFTQSGSGSLSFSSALCFVYNGKCSVTATPFTAGTVTVQATYSGDYNNNPGVASTVHPITIRP